MSALVELEQAARLHRAEDRWLDSCADRLRRASSRRGVVAGTTVAPVEPTVTAEGVR